MTEEGNELLEPEYAEAAGLWKGIAWAVTLTIIVALVIWLLVRR